MQKIDMRELCERRFRQLIKDYGLPEPDEVKLEPEAVLFLWDDQKLIVKVELDQIMGREALKAYERERLSA